MDDPYELSYKVFVNVLFFGGPRRGEAKAIRWNDINFEKQEITIDEQFIDKDPIHGRIVCDLKTENSARTISYDEMTFRLIKKLYDYRSKEPNFQATDFLFTGPNSKLPFSDNGIRKRIEKHAHIAGLAPINPHGFRHSFASFSYGMGTDLKTISNQLGHSNTTTTMDIYVSMLNDNNEERVNKINVARRKLMIDDDETN